MLERAEAAPLVNTSTDCTAPEKLGGGERLAAGATPAVLSVSREPSCLPLLFWSGLHVRVFFLSPFVATNARTLCSGSCRKQAALRCLRPLHTRARVEARALLKRRTKRGAGTIFQRVGKRGRGFHTASERCEYANQAGGAAMAAFGGRQPLWCSAAPSGPKGRFFPAARPDAWNGRRDEITRPSCFN